MSEFEVGETLGGIADSLVKVCESVKVIGEPIQAGDKMIIPAVVTRLGFGAGGGSGMVCAPVPEEGEEEPAGPSGSGGGGGGGVMLTPIFLVIDSAGERLITVPGAVDLASAVLGRARQALDRVLPRRGEGDESAADDEPDEDS